MPSKREFPSPDDRRAEQMLKTQLGREVLRLFNVWDDPYIAPEVQREEGQLAINRMARLVEEAAVARGIIPAPIEGSESPCVP